MEMQRLLMPTATARWVIVHTPRGGPRFVLPDTGYVLGGPQSIVENCVVTVPIGPHTAIALGHQWWRTVADGTSGQWRTAIEHRDVDGRFAELFNAEAARTCERMVVAGDPEVLTGLVGSISKNPEPSIDCLWLTAIDRSALCAMELDWFKLLTVLRRCRPRDRRVGNFERDVRAYGRYVSTITFTADRPRFEHIALATDDTATAIYACMPAVVDLSDSSMVKITYAPDAPSWRIRGTVGDPADLPADPAGN
jgi:hypothetical protein